MISHQAEQCVMITGAYLPIHEQFGWLIFTLHAASSSHNEGFPFKIIVSGHCCLEPGRKSGLVLSVIYSNVLLLFSGLFTLQRFMNARWRAGRRAARKLNGASVVSRGGRPGPQRLCSSSSSDQPLSLSASPQVNVAAPPTPPCCTLCLQLWPSSSSSSHSSWCVKWVDFLCGALDARGGKIKLLCYHEQHLPFESVP